MTDKFMQNKLAKEHKTFPSDLDNNNSNHLSVSEAQYSSRGNEITNILHTKT